MAKRANSGNKEIGERIRRRRMSLGFKQVELADMLGHSDSNTVSRWERGVLGVSTESISKLADVLGVTTDHLLNGAMPPESLTIKAESKDEKAKDSGAAPSSLPPSNVRLAEEFVMVPVVSSDVRVCCGEGSGYPDEVAWEIVGERPVRSASLMGHVGNFDNMGVRVIRVEGDSMEPLIHDDEYVLITDSDIDKVRDGDVCVVFYDGRIYIRAMIMKPAKTILRAMNKTYMDIVITPDSEKEFCVLCKVLRALPPERTVSSIYG